MSTLRADYIAVTEEIISKIKNEITRTGVSPRRLTFASDYKGNFNFIYKILSNKQKSISQNRLNEIIDIYKQLPTKSNSNRDRPVREGYVEITGDIIDQIEHHIKRTGLTIHSFINIYGLNYIGIQNVEHWKSGYSKSAPQEHLETILNMWATVPDNYYISVTPEMSDFVKNEIKRTGYGAYKILRGNKAAKEKGITAATINLIANGCSKKMKATIIHQILALWKDKPNRNS